MAIVALPLIAGIYAGHWIGRHYGWGYHVLILVALAAYMAFMFRIALGKRLKKEVDLSTFQSSSPEAQSLGEQVAEMHAGAVRLDEKLRLDAYLVPALLFAPMIVVLLVLGQSAYSEEHRNWFSLSLVLLIPYLLVRYAMPHKRA